ncbi:MAG: S8 family serine peptidase [Fretibacterium sp.]|nr:S8 family serine peptidase [Fretibacterium sp.]
MRRICCVFLLLLCAFLSGSPASARTIPGEVLVVFREPPAASDVSVQGVVRAQARMARAEAIAEEVGAHATRTFDALSEQGNGVFAHLRSDTKSEEELVRELLARSDVVAASPNYETHTLDTVPNDSHYTHNDLWGLEAINAPSVWEQHTGAGDVYVAVLDTGIRTTHEDLAANIAESSYHADHTGSGSYADGNGHGTHVAGIIGAVGNNGTGVVGVNWTVKLIARRVMGDDGKGSTSHIVSALNALASLLRANPSLKLAAVNLSIGYYSSMAPASEKTDVMWQALSNLSSLNRAVICVAAGNEAVEVGKPTTETKKDVYNTGQYCYPASFTDIDNMIVVGAAESATELDASYSNFSALYVDIAAPGTKICSTYHTTDQSYAYLGGTSMATPHVAGAAALLKAAYPDAAASQIKKAILDGAQNASSFSGKTRCGFLDLKGALDKMTEGTAPGVTSTSLSAGKVGVPYQAKLDATGDAPIRWSVSGALPGGLSLNASTGIISGAPTAAGTSSFTVTASNSAGSAVKDLAITIADVAPVIATLSLPDGAVGAGYKAEVALSAGTGAINWNINGSLPSGLSFNGGIISGTPTRTGTYSFRLTASNSAGRSSQWLVITILDVLPVIATSSLPDGIVGTAYSAPLGLSAGTGTVRWSLNGNLPRGLSLNASAGIISGTPRTAGTYSFTVRAANSSGSGTQALSLTVRDSADDDEGNWPDLSLDAEQDAEQGNERIITRGGASAVEDLVLSSVGTSQVTVPFVAFDAPDTALDSKARQLARERFGGDLGVITKDVEKYLSIPAKPFGDLRARLNAVRASLAGSGRSLGAVLPPVQAAQTGVYLVKLSLSSGQKASLKGRRLAYLITPWDSAAVRTAGDSTNGVLVDTNGNPLTGEYAGQDLHVLVSVTNAGTAYNHYLTQETASGGDTKGSNAAAGGGGGGCHAAGLSWAGYLMVLLAFALRSLYFERHRE